jgi:hypothetical protein
MNKESGNKKGKQVKKEKVDLYTLLNVKNDATKEEIVRN